MTVGRVDEIKLVNEPLLERIIVEQLRNDHRAAPRCNLGVSRDRTLSLSNQKVMRWPDAGATFARPSG